MILYFKSFIYFIIVYFKLKNVESIIIPKQTYTFINTHSNCNLNTSNRINKLKLNKYKLSTSFKNRSLKLKATDDFKLDFSKVLGDKYSELPDYKKTHKSLDTDLSRYMTFKELILANSSTIIMAAVYIIRLFRILVDIRFLLDHLTQINPYMPPFKFIYDTTKFYVKIFDFFPTIFGINLLSLAPWSFISLLERYLLSQLSKNE